MSDLKSIRDEGIANRTSRLKKFGGSTQEEVSRVLNSGIPERASGGAVRSRATGGVVGDAMSSPRLDRKSPGKKKAATTNVNVIIAPQGDGGAPPAGGLVGAGPPPMAPPGPPMGPPGGPPLPMRKAGGRVKKADGGPVSDYLRGKEKDAKVSRAIYGLGAGITGAGAIADPEPVSKLALGAGAVGYAGLAKREHDKSKRMGAAADKFDATGLPGGPDKDAEERKAGGRVHDGAGGGKGRLEKIGKKA